MGDLDTWLQILFWSVIIIICIGCVRVFFTRPRTYGDFFMEVLCLDLISDLIIAIIEGLD
jgi:hypothetical protein